MKAQTAGQTVPARRGLLGMLVMTAGLLLTACTTTGPGDIGPAVDALPPDVVAGGETLVGERLVSEVPGEIDVLAFRGIPYAAAPVGGNRWRAPQAHVPRAGLQSATSFAPACPQTQSNAEWYRDVAAAFGHSRDIIPPTEPISEDCLFLNVWTSDAAKRSGGRPVLLWIHGGGNRDGYAHEPDYRGHTLARRDVVVISINYRLGLLGFMGHPALSAESPSLLTPSIPWDGRATNRAPLPSIPVLGIPVRTWTRQLAGSYPAGINRML